MPSAAERELIAENIVQTQAHIQRLDVEMHILRHQLDQIALEHKYHHLRGDELRAILAPHKSLPPELLCEIFLDSLDSLPSGHHIVISRRCNLEQDRKDSNRVWKLGQVCARWRRIVLNEPRLWNSISLVEAPDELLPMIKEALWRSGQSCLKLLKLQTKPECLWHPINPDTFDLMMDHIHRIESLELTIPPHFMVHFLCLSIVLPALKHVYIGTTNRVDKTLVIPPSGFNIFRNSRNLQSVIMGAHTSSFLSHLNLPWNQLTKFHLGCWHVPISQILSKCPNLVFLKLDEFENKPLSPQVKISLSNLRELELLNPREFALSASNLAIFAPVLTRLTINSSYHNIGPFLKHTPSPLHLDAPHGTLVLPTIQMMLSGECVPNLETLQCCVHYDNAHVLVDMLEERWRGQCTIDMQPSPALGMRFVRVEVREAAVNLDAMLFIRTRIPVDKDTLFY